MGSEQRNTPEDMKRVFFRRRLTVAAILLAVVVAVLLIVFQPGSRGGAAAAREVAVPSDLAAVAQSEVAASDNPGDAPACDAGVLRVTPQTSRASYAPNEAPEFTLSVENTGDATCHADLGTAQMVFEVTSGSDQIWRSTDCQQNSTQLLILLEPGVPLTTEPLSWDRTRSNAETCDIGTDEVAGAGGATYHLRVEAAGVTGQGTAAFLLY